MEIVNKCPQNPSQYMVNSYYLVHDYKPAHIDGYKGKFRYIYTPEKGYLEEACHNVEQRTQDKSENDPRAL